MADGQVEVKHQGSLLAGMTNEVSGATFGAGDIRSYYWKALAPQLPSEVKQGGFFILDVPLCGGQYRTDNEDSILWWHWLPSDWPAQNVYVVSRSVYGGDRLDDTKVILLNETGNVTVNVMSALSDFRPLSELAWWASGRRLGVSVCGTVHGVILLEVGVRFILRSCLFEIKRLDPQHRTVVLDCWTVGEDLRWPKGQ